MEKSLSELLAPYSLTGLTLPKSIRKDLATYEHITLTDEELVAVILQAKIKKEQYLEMQAKIEKQQKLYSHFTADSWTIAQTKAFMEWRMGRIYGTPFRLDGGNEWLYNLLCAYFSKDSSFEDLAKNAGVKNPRLTKGLLLAGGVGVGKTHMMKLFAINHRQVYRIWCAQELADQWLERGDSWLPFMIRPFEVPANDQENLYQRQAGICIDDLGAEMTKNSFGNKKNVVGELIEGKYADQHGGDLLHITTNLTSTQLKEFYGERVTSRLREMMNMVVLKGEDRRK